MSGEGAWRSGSGGPHHAPINEKKCKESLPQPAAHQGSDPLWSTVMAIPLPPLYLRQHGEGGGRGERRLSAACRRPWRWPPRCALLLLRPRLPLSTPLPSSWRPGQHAAHVGHENVQPRSRRSLVASVPATTMSQDELVESSWLKMSAKVGKLGGKGGREVGGWVRGRRCSRQRHSTGRGQPRVAPCPIEHRVRPPQIPAHVIEPAGRRAACWGMRPEARASAARRAWRRRRSQRDFVARVVLGVAAVAVDEGRVFRRAAAAGVALLLVHFWEAGSREPGASTPCPRSPPCPSDAHVDGGAPREEWHLLHRDVGALLASHRGQQAGHQRDQQRHERPAERRHGGGGGGHVRLQACCCTLHRRVTTACGLQQHRGLCGAARGREGTRLCPGHWGGAR